MNGCATPLPTEADPRSRARVARPMMILVAGPYRSGTGDDPALLARNVAAMHEAAWPLYRRGHLPVIGEDLALPLAAVAGSRRPGDPAFDEVFHPFAKRLLMRCDAVLRIGGESEGADLMIRLARWEGKPVYYRLDDIPELSQFPVHD